METRILVLRCLMHCSVYIMMTSFAHSLCACVGLFEPSAIIKGADPVPPLHSMRFPAPAPVIVQRGKFEAFPLSPFSSSSSLWQIFADFSNITRNLAMKVHYAIFRTPRYLQAKSETLNSSGLGGDVLQTYPHTYIQTPPDLYID